MTLAWRLKWAKEKYKIIQLHFDYSGALFFSIKTKSFDTHLPDLPSLYYCFSLFLVLNCFCRSDQTQLSPLCELWNLLHSSALQPLYDWQSLKIKSKQVKRLAFGLSQMQEKNLMDHTKCLKSFTYNTGYNQRVLPMIKISRSPKCDVLGAQSILSGAPGYEAPVRQQPCNL